MKWVLIVVILPNVFNETPGREMHQPFDSRQECMQALAHVRLQSSTEGWGYCTTQANETWYYRDQVARP